MPDVPQLRPDKMYLPDGWIRSKPNTRIPIDTSQESPRVRAAKQKKLLAAKKKPKATNPVAYAYAYQNQLGRKIGKWVQE